MNLNIRGIAETRICRKPICLMLDSCGAGEEVRKPSMAYRFVGGVEDGKGWRGDVKIIQLSVDKLLRTGWISRHSSEQANRIAVRALIREV